MIRPGVLQDIQPSHSCKRRSSHDCSAARANYNLGTVPRIQRRWVIRGGWCTQRWPTQDCHPGSTDVAVQALNWPAGRTFVNALPPPKSKLAFVKSVFSRPLHLVLLVLMFCLQFSCWLSSETHQQHVGHWTETGISAGLLKKCFDFRSTTLRSILQWHCF